MKKKSLLKLNDVALDKAVKIEGTIYDRKRVLNNDEVHKASQMLNAGKSLKAVAAKYGVAESTIKYNTDPEYRERVLAKATGKHTGVTNYTLADRAEYKRSLVAAGKNVVVVY